MKLCAIYNVWDDWDLLRLSIKNISPYVDGIIVMVSEYSNYGEYSPIPVPISGDPKVLAYPNIPKDGIYVMDNECRKRNQGLEIARQLGFTHFLMMDADEFYNPIDFQREKQRFIDNPDLAGLVCATQVYFKKPTLTIGLDTTLVPFIHRITTTLKHEFNRRYPFAWEGHNIRIDPTRSLNINEGVEWSEIVMHHVSWYRRDYAKKIRNSTARANIERSTILDDLENAKPGYFCKFYQKTLHEVPNYFNLPEF